LTGVSKGLALITGVGGGTGAAIARRFASAGYALAMIARDGSRLSTLEREIAGAQGFACDVGDRQSFADTLEAISRALGPVDVAIHNAVAATFATFDAVSLDTFERNFRVNAAALLQLAQAVAPGMVARGGGTLIVTGNTSAYRGTPTYAGFAPTKAAQRSLAQALAKDLGPKRVHVAYVAIDGPIEAPWLAEAPGARPYEPPSDSPHPREDYFSQPAAIAEEVYHIAHQHPSTWSFDHVIRPYTERWTLN